MSIVTGDEIHNKGDLVYFADHGEEGIVRVAVRTISAKSGKEIHLNRGFPAAGGSFRFGLDMRFATTPFSAIQILIESDRGGVAAAEKVLEEQKRYLEEAERCIRNVEPGKPTSIPRYDLEL